MVGNNLLSSALKIALKFFIAYFFLGTIALLVVFFSYGWAAHVKTGINILDAIDAVCSMEPIEAFKNFHNILLYELPFSDEMDKLYSGTEFFDGIGGIIKYIYSFINKDSIDSPTKMWTGLFPNITKIVLANLIFYLLSRFNKLFSGPTLDLVYSAVHFIVSFFWTLASFSLSAAIMIFLQDKYKNPIDLISAYWVIFLFTLIIHSCLLSNKKISNIKIFVYLLVNTILNIINSVVIWLCCYKLLQLNPSSILGAFAFMLFIIFITQKISTWILSPTGKIH